MITQAEVFEKLRTHYENIEAPLNWTGGGCIGYALVKLGLIPKLSIENMMAVMRLSRSQADRIFYLTPTDYQVERNSHLALIDRWPLAKQKAFVLHMLDTAMEGDVEIVEPKGEFE